MLCAFAARAEAPLLVFLSTLIRGIASCHHKLNGFDGECRQTMMKNAMSSPSASKAGGDFGDDDEPIDPEIQELCDAWRGLGIQRSLFQSKHLPP